MTDEELRNAVSFIWSETVRQPDWKSIGIWFGGVNAPINGYGGDRDGVFYTFNAVDKNGFSGLERFLKCFNWEKKIVVTYKENHKITDMEKWVGFLEISPGPFVSGFSSVQGIKIFV